MLPLIVTGVAAATGIAWWRAKHKKGLTPERKKIYEAAMKSSGLSPDKVRALADSFEKEGLKEEAANLRKRAALMELPPDVKAARRKAYKRGMKSNDPAAVTKLANAFHKEGALSAAQSLHKYAAGLKKSGGKVNVKAGVKAA